VLAACTLVAGCGSDSTKGGTSSTPARSSDARAAAKPRAFRIPGGSGHLALMAPRDGLTLRDRPNGRVIAHLQARTRWGSATIVWAAERRGGWLGVVAADAGNGRLGWIDAMHERPRIWRSRLSVHADLSERALELRKNGKVVRRIPVTVGSPSTPTPTGRFAVTDKLVPAYKHGDYGCCVLALSGHQPLLRPGWAGGDRIAIHGSPDELTGGAASAGCLRARDADLEKLMDGVPLGTPVVIRD
jgi:hypothetical protein